MKKENLLGNTLLYCLGTILGVFLLLTSCGGKQQNDMTPQMAMDSFITKNPIEGAVFYTKNRGVYNFMDQLYSDSIVPVLNNCNYYELKRINLILEDTPNEKFVKLLYLSSRKKLLKDVYQEIQNNCQVEIQTLLKVVLPIIKMDIDSTLEADLKDVFSKYAGGFLNYRKINFLLGRNQKDFKNMFWERIDTTQYKMQINRYLQAYLDTIALRQRLYSTHLTGKEINNRVHIYQPLLTIGLSKSTMRYIKKYTREQKGEIIIEGLKDYVLPLALATVTSGSSLVYELYDAGNDVYDVAITIKDIKDADVDADDMVVYICTHDLSYQIDNYYLNKCTDSAIGAIRKSNIRLYNYIIKNL